MILWVLKFHLDTSIKPEERNQKLIVNDSNMHAGTAKIVWFLINITQLKIVVPYRNYIRKESLLFQGEKFPRKLRLIKYHIRRAVRESKKEQMEL